MSSYRVLGDGPDPFAPEQQTLTSEEILRVLALDPSDSMDHGRLRAIRYKLEAKRGVGGPTREQQLVDWTLTVEPKERERRVYDNPARIHGGRRERRSLTPGDLAFVRSFEGADPKAVPAEDVKLLAELEAAAETESERRVVARVFGPIRRHHDYKEEQAELLNEIDRSSPSGFRSAKVREAWQPVLAQRLAEEARAEIEPQLAELPPDVREKTLRSVELDAQQQAQQRIREVWAGLEAEASGRLKAARERLSALTSGAHPQSSAIRTPETSASKRADDGGERPARPARHGRTLSPTSGRWRDDGPAHPHQPTFSRGGPRPRRR